MADAPAKPLLLLVDDAPEILDVLRGILGPEFRLKIATGGEKALRLAHGPERPDLVVLDVMMPDLDGYEVCRRLKADPATARIPVIFLSARDQVFDETSGFAVGAVDYVTKPVIPEILLARVRTHVELKLAREEIERHADQLEQKVRERTAELAQTQEVTIQSLAALAETRDLDTGLHIVRTGRYVRALAERMALHPRYAPALTPSAIELICKSAALHDIGKVGIPDHILLKPGRLTREEFELMKQHADLGARAIEKAERMMGVDHANSFLRYAREIAQTHQEKWDGTGYPRGLKGEGIPIAGRLMAVADVYDALISRRVYKEPMTHEQAVERIREGSGTHFDPDLVEGFLSIHPEFKRIAAAFADDHGAGQPA
ncbi:MAG: two-component system response regulator [Candidatus Riflebacteria bacterium]|nr:two-component system response regulator [Candidatus Riflebacteria bacterium]